MREVLFGALLPMLGAALIVATVSASRAGEDGGPDEQRTRFFAIPAQPLATALQAYGQVAGVQLLYESKSAEGRWSTAIEGLFSSREALTRLLAGTDIKMQYSRPGAVTLMLDRSGDIDSGVPRFGADLSLGTLHVQGGGQGSSASVDEYSASVQSDVHKALRKNPRTRDGNYRVVVSLWINNERVVEQVDVTATSGDPARDSALIATLRGLTMTRPQPQGAPQPVRISVSVWTH